MTCLFQNVGSGRSSSSSGPVGADFKPLTTNPTTVYSAPPTSATSRAPASNEGGGIYTYIYIYILTCVKALNVDQVPSMICFLCLHTFINLKLPQIM